MSTSPEPQKRDYPSTYVVQDQQSKEELTRLTFQDQLITTAMGGVLPEHPDPTRLKRVLDIGCGSGSWIIEAAKQYPGMSLIGVDISPRMVNYAREQAAARGVSQRTEFLVMDALRVLEFRPEYFDLVNLRFGVSFVRTWDWPNLLSEMQRVTRPGGIVRVVETDVSRRYDDPSLAQFEELMVHALFRAGHLFTEESTGLTAHLPRLLTQHGCRNVQTRIYELEFRANTPEGQMHIEDGKRAFQTLRPFLQKWGCHPKNYEEIISYLTAEVSKPTFRTIWPVLAVWGTKVSS